MLQRPVLAFTCTCTLALAACGDSGSSTAGGLSSAGITSMITSATSVSTSKGSEGSSGDDSGQGGTAGTGGAPTTSAGASATEAGSTGPGEATTTTTTTTTSGDGTTSGGDTTTGECAAITEMAMNKKQPADIIFVIDNSGSMDTEIASVQSNMNAFSTKIINSGIDVHVILLSAQDSICIDPPLGSGGCPVKDNNPPKLLHVNTSIGSNDALQKVIAHYPDYKDALRPDASTHVVVVTDDNSDLGANAFDTMFKALDPGFADYKLHAICGAKDSGDILWCAQNALCCAFTADKGSVYLDLINKTGGEWGDLCLQDFTPVFNVLSTEVIQNATLACEWVIPDPMGDDPIDFGKVNVDFDDGMNNVQTIGKVESEADCANVSDGWYYDDPMKPTKIYVCPQTCAKIQGVKDAKINIKFGCETVIAQ